MPTLSIDHIAFISSKSDKLSQAKLSRPRSLRRAPGTFPPASTSTSTTSRTVHDAFPLLLLTRDDGGFSAVIAEGELSAADQTLGVLGDVAEDGETDAADEARVDDVAVAEAGSAEVHGVLGGGDEGGPGVDVGEVAEHEVREQAARVRGAGEEDAVSDESSLLEECRGRVECGGVNWYPRVRGGEYGVHCGDVLRWLGF